TVMAKLVTDAEAQAAEQDATAQEDRLLVAMHNRPTGSLIDWAADCRWFTDGDPARPNKFLAHRLANRLRKDKLVATERQNLVLTQAGKKAAKNALAEQAKKAAQG